MMPPDYRRAMTEAAIWLRVNIPHAALPRLGAAYVDIETSFNISFGLKQDAETAKARAIANIKDMYFR